MPGGCATLRRGRAARRRAAALGNDGAWLERLTAVGRAPACRSWPRSRPLSPALPQDPARHADRDPAANDAGRRRLRAGAQCRAAPAIRLRLAQLYPAQLLEETLAIAARCTFSLDELRYEYPDEIVPAGDTPASWLRALTDDGAAQRYPEGDARQVRAQIEHELALIAELRYEPYFLTVARHRALRARADDPLPGARLGRQLGGLLLPWHHRGRPGTHERCCSSASSATNATSRPTSTSTSSTSGAKKSCSTSTASTGASARR